MLLAGSSRSMRRSILLRCLVGVGEILRLIEQLVFCLEQGLVLVFGLFLLAMRRLLIFLFQLLRGVLCLFLLRLGVVLVRLLLLAGHLRGCMVRLLEILGFECFVFALIFAFLFGFVFLFCRFVFTGFVDFMCIYRVLCFLGFWVFCLF